MSTVQTYCREWVSPAYFLPDGIRQVYDIYLRENAGALPRLEDKRSSPDEGKTNGTGGQGHKIEEESEAAFRVVNEAGCPAGQKLADTASYSQICNQVVIVH